MIMRFWLLMVMCLVAVPAFAGPLGTDRYDKCIRASAVHYWLAGPDWLYWRAQLFQESRLNPTAKSPVGARGLAQFMPETWRDMTKALRWGLVSRDDACASARAGAYYMARLQRIWNSPRPQMERHKLAQASYNAGAGHIIKAQRLCGGVRDWRDISKCLPQVTGRHSRETIGYVDRIERWRRKMGALR